MKEMPYNQRLLIVITTLTFGGAETQVVRLATEFKRLGWEVAIVCLVAPTNWHEQLRSNGIQVLSLDMARGMPDLRAIFRLRRIIQSFRPDIVHSHMVHANLLARFTRLVCPMATLICTAHNLRETSEKGGPTWHKELLYRVTDFLADRTTIICQTAFDRYVKVGAVPAGKFEVVPNGIDIEQFSSSPDSRLAARHSLALAEATFVWLAVGRLVEQKDYPTLLAAVRLLPEQDFCVLVAGNGPLLEPLRSEVSRLGLDGRVKFLGASENIRHLFAAADAFVMSSVFEGLSAALLEASAMGLPSVVTDAGGNTEIVTHEKTGYVVPPSSAESLADAMTRMMRLDREALQELGATARQRCVNAYRFEVVVDHWLDLYARCTKRKPQTPSPAYSPLGMKILYVITKGDRGGAQVHLLDLLSSLPPGYQAVIATGETGFLTDEASRLQIPVCLIPDLVQPIRPLKDLKALVELVSSIRNIRPDLIHVHTSKAALLGRIAGVLTGTPAVFTAHTWSFTDGIPWLQKSISVPLERLAAFACKKIINVSQANVAMAMSQSIANLDRMVCIWNGIPDVPDRANPGSGTTTTLIMTARFVPQKNHLLFVQAMAGVRGDWRIKLVGDGPTRSAVQEAVERLNIRDRVSFVGESKDVARLLAEADIFVLSSNWEGLPLSILEAMRASLPVVATKVGGVAESVEDGVTGYLTPPGNLPVLRDRLQTLISSKTLQRQMGMRGRDRYEKDFQIEAMVNKTLGIYNEVLEYSGEHVVDDKQIRQESSK